MWRKSATWVFWLRDLDDAVGGRASGAAGLSSQSGPDRGDAETPRQGDPRPPALSAQQPHVPAGSRTAPRELRADLGEDRRASTGRERVRAEMDGPPGHAGGLEVGEPPVAVLQGRCART